jgi:PAS domain S-box-containing protein
MPFKNLPIKRKMMLVVMVTSITALVLTAASFITYDLVTFRQNLVRNLTSISKIVADNSTRALLMDSEGEALATHNLAEFKVDRHVRLAALYDRHGKLRAQYPTNAPASEFPPSPGAPGAYFGRGKLVVIVQSIEDGKLAGTLYVESSLGAVYERLRLYGGLAGLIIFGSALVALGVSSALQRRVTDPILALVHSAKMVSDRTDLSVRAPKTSADELGLLTDSFNLMLARIQEHTEERKQVEESLAFLAAIVQSSDDAIIGKDLQSRVLSWNIGAERMFGYTAAEMVGQPITRLLSPDRPDEEPQVIEEVKRGKTRHFETIRIRKDGEPIHVSLTISPIKNAKGETIGVSSIARDTTERKRAHESLERHAAVLREQAQMLDLANVMARDLDSRIILWNSGMEKMYGWSKDEALGKNSHELLRTRFPESLETILAELHRNGHWEGELIHFDKAGRQLAVSSQWVLHSNAQGQPAAILEVNNDITERKRAEEEVRRMNIELEHRVDARTAQLKAANQELEAFTYSVAHDLRAPLRHIDAFSRILSDDFASSLPPEARRYLETIRNGSRNMSQLVDDLLNLARVGRQELRRKPIPLGGLVTEVVADLKRETEGRQIEWHIRQLPTVECDPGLMKQVFTNLLSNAVKYTRPRQKSVIEVGSGKANGSTAIFVRDNGVGFNMKYVDKLFGVFQRLHRAEEFEGTGVGLATVDRILRKHGGSIWAESGINQGATFYFTVPGLEGINDATIATPEVRPTRSSRTNEARQPEVS